MVDETSTVTVMRVTRHALIAVGLSRDCYRISLNERHAPTSSCRMLDQRIEEPEILATDRLGVGYTVLERNGLNKILETFPS